MISPSLRTLLDHLHDRVLVIGPDDEIEYLNRSLARGYSLEPDEWIGTPLSELVDAYVCAEHVPELFRLIAGVRTGTAERDHLEIRTCEPDGRLHREHVRICPLSESKGYLALIAANATVRSETEPQMLREAREETEQAHEMKSTLLANMSHEFRTPLASVVGFADLLSSEVGGHQQRFVRMIRRSGERLLNTLEAVLDLVQLEGRKFDLHSEKLDAADVVDDVIRSLESEAQEKGVPVHRRFSEPAVEALLDRSALSRMATHVLRNAIKFTEEGSVTVGLWTEEEHLVLQVTDTGIGIDPTHQSAVFDPFHQESQGLNRAYGGAGLGLAITQRLAELLGGTIDLESSPGEGTTVTIRLPRETPGSGEADASLESADGALHREDPPHESRSDPRGRP